MGHYIREARGVAAALELCLEIFADACFLRYRSADVYDRCHRL